MIIVITNLCLVRLLLLEIADRGFHTIGAMAAVNPLTWFLATVSFVCYYRLIRKQMLQ